MNIDKMRRTLERGRVASERRERAAWLASLTPEHRAKHEGPMIAWMCGECVAATQKRAGWALADAMTSLARIGRP